MFHALLAGGPERLTTAGRLGLPQVICPGAVEVLVFHEPHTVPAQYRGRTLVRHSPQITDLRLNDREMVDVAREVGRRLQDARGPAVVMIPSRGFDAYDVDGQPLFDPEADAAFVAELRRCVPPSMPFLERPTHINDPAFAVEAAETLIRLLAPAE
jgi:uncharacterized protein (UPF0261 family)